MGPLLVGLGAVCRDQQVDVAVAINVDRFHGLQRVVCGVESADVVVGEYFADLLIEDRLIMEIKAVQKIVKQHEVQLVGYLAATKHEIGLLINFGPSVQIKHKHRQYTPSQ